MTPGTFFYRKVTRMSLLDTVGSPSDLKRMSDADLENWIEINRAKIGSI